jgi:hypothetical protein
VRLFQDQATLSVEEYEALPAEEKFTGWLLIYH